MSTERDAGYPWDGVAAAFDLRDLADDVTVTIGSWEDDDDPFGFHPLVRVTVKDFRVLRARLRSGGTQGAPFVPDDSDLGEPLTVAEAARRGRIGQAHTGEPAEEQAKDHTSQRGDASSPRRSGDAESMDPAVMQSAGDGDSSAGQARRLSDSPEALLACLKEAGDPETDIGAKVAAFSGILSDVCADAARVLAAHTGEALHALSDNVHWLRLTEAMRDAMSPDQKVGDFIDRGLIIRRKLEEAGYALVPLARPAEETSE